MSMVEEPISRFLPLPDRPIVQENGEVQPGPLTLHYWEWQGHQPTILFCHAASLHGRCYDPIINEALRGHRVISLDLRGHGRSQQHPAPYRFPWFGGDVIQLIEQLNLSSEQLIGIGHSMGGYALAWAAASASTRLFQSLLLIDPGILPRSLYGAGEERRQPLKYILRRKNQWISVEQMIEKLGSRVPFSRWSKETLRNYCTYALDDQSRLRCTAEAEHSMYHSSFDSSSNIYPLIEQSTWIQQTPVHVVRTSIPLEIGQFDTSPTGQELAHYFRKGRDTYLKDAKHFFPMDQPEVLIELIRDHLKKNVRSRLWIF